MCSVRSETTALPGLADAVTQAANLAERAAGTGLEAAALSLYGTLLSVADSAAGALADVPAEGIPVALALLASSILQGRAVLASREVTAEALSAARMRGREEGREEVRAGLRAAARTARAAVRGRRGGGGATLRAVS